jgi:hypothetical protein
LSEVRRQIWESLHSMLRVYAEAASLKGIRYEAKSGPNGASIEHKDDVLALTFSASSGAGAWHINGEKRGTFQIEADGTLQFPEGPKELDVAAIDWIEQMSSQPERSETGLQPQPCT